MRTGSLPGPGMEIGGYRLEELIGRGGMGAVFRAEDLSLGRRVAVKLLARELADNERFRERFLRESQLAASLDHPNIVPIYAAGEDDGQLYLAMRFVAGTDLRRLLARDAPLSAERALAIVGQVAEALDVAHEHGLVHRDVKPANVLVAEQSGREHCYLGDFGLTKQTASISGLTGTGELVGTIAYVSPEQIRGDPVDARADVYSLGCVLFECLTGQSPFARDTEVAALWAHVNEPPPALTARRPELPRAIDGALARALAKKPGDRQASCTELVADAAVALDSAVPPSSSAKQPARTGAPRLSRRALLVAGAAAATAAAFGGGLALFRRDSTLGRVAAESVGVVDADTRDVVAGIPVGFSSRHIASGEGSIWVLDPDGSTLTKIDPKTAAVVPPTRGIPADGVPIGLAVGEGSIWVALNQGRALVVLEVGPDVGELRRRITVGTKRTDPFVLGREDLVLTVGDGAVWVLERGLRGEITRIDPATGAAKLFSDGHQDSSSIAVHSGAVWLGGLNGVKKLDAKTAVDLGRAFVEVDLGPVSSSIAIGHDAVWFTADPGARVWRIHPQSVSILDSFPIGSGGTSLAVAERGGIWVTRRGATSLSHIDPKAETVGTVELGTTPQGLAAGFGRIWTSPGMSSL